MTSFFEKCPRREERVTNRLWLHGVGEVDAPGASINGGDDGGAIVDVDRLDFSPGQGQPLEWPVTRHGQPRWR